MLSFFKPNIDKITQRLVSPLAGIDPNTLTLIGIVPSLLFFVSVINHLYWLSLIFYLGNVFDLLDGAVAKRFHKVTPFGGFLDSTIDRISDFLIITAFGFAGLVNWPIVLSLLLFSYLVSYARSRAELASRATQVFAVGLIERTERLAIIFFSLLAYLIFPQLNIANFNIIELIFLILIILSVITFLQRINAAYKRL
ncbi:MAG TPA: CDP-alcohol phosphatidyltransferase family protein [Patescibacteria group bacterium]|nr:CDP-alcohol phosphatidyltransferase family protein [Patescibacteria group bacterium]